MLRWLCNGVEGVGVGDSEVQRKGVGGNSSGGGSESYYLCRGLQGNGRVPLVVLE